MESWEFPWDLSIDLTLQELQEYCVLFRLWWYKIFGWIRKTQLRRPTAHTVGICPHCERWDNKKMAKRWKEQVCVVHIADFGLGWEMWTCRWKLVRSSHPKDQQEWGSSANLVFSRHCYLFCALAFSFPNEKANVQGVVSVVWFIQFKGNTSVVESFWPLFTYAQANVDAIRSRYTLRMK